METIGKSSRAAGASLFLVLVMSWIGRADAGPPAGDAVRIGGDDPFAVVNVPVEDSKTRCEAGALFEPEGPDTSPIVGLSARYHGHHVAYQEAAALDARKRAPEIEALIK